MSIWSSSQKVCGSCRFWQGIREVNPEFTLFMPTSKSGKCINPESEYENTETFDNFSCPKWQRYK